VKKMMVSHHQLLSPPAEAQHRRSLLRTATWVVDEHDADGASTATYSRKRSLRT
jgi:hypothetical protein